MYILRPHTAGILYTPPPFIHPSHPLKGLFRGGGVEVYKIWPRIKNWDLVIEFKGLL